MNVTGSKNSFVRDYFLTIKDDQKWHIVMVGKFCTPDKYVRWDRFIWASSFYPIFGKWAFSMHGYLLFLKILLACKKPPGIMQPFIFCIKRHGFAPDLYRAVG